MAVLNDEQVMLRDMAREWADNESPVTAFRKLRAAAPEQGFDPEAWSAIGQMGWAGVVVPEEHGGSAFGYLSMGLVIEQLGRNLAVSPLASVAPAATAIAMGSDENAKTEWLPKIAVGEAVIALAIDEGPHHAPDKLETRVDGGMLTGTKAFVAEGDGAQAFVVAAQAIVGFIDALCIGVGLVVLGVPLALPLAVLTFFGAFIPIVGALTAGILSALIALVANGFTNALIVVALILAVQQIEGNLLQPLVQGRGLGLHAAVIILAVTGGSSVAGIVGAFLAVPVAAVVAPSRAILAWLVGRAAGEGPWPPLAPWTGSP